MDNEKKESILRKVKKLLSLSNSSNEHEAALAAARAHELLLKYNLTLEEAGHAEEDVVRISAGCSYKRPPAWLVELFVVVCQNFYCSPQRGGSGEMLILGGKTDVEVAKFTFGYLSEEVKRLVKIFSKRYLHLYRTYINDYALGVCFSITRAFDEMSRVNESRAEATGSAIVPLLSAKKDAINKYLEKDPDYDPKPKKRTGADISSKAAFRAGLEDGKSIKVARGGLAETTL